MKWTNKRTELLKTLGVLRPLTKPGESSFFERIRFKDGKVSAYDGWTQVEVPSPWPIEGSCRGGVIYDVLNSASQAEDVVTELKDSTLTFKMGSARFSTVLDQESQVSPFVLEEDALIELELDEEFRNAVQLALLSAKDDVGSPYSGVWLLFRESGFTVVGTDSTATLAATTIPVQYKENVVVTVPIRSWAYILRTFDADESVMVRICPSGVEVVSEAGVCTTTSAKRIPVDALDKIDEQGIGSALRIKKEGVAVNLDKDVVQAFRSLKIVEGAKEAGQFRATEIKAEGTVLTIRTVGGGDAKLDYTLTLPTSVKPITSFVRSELLCPPLAKFPFEKLYLSETHLVLEGGKSLFLISGSRSR